MRDRNAVVERIRDLSRVAADRGAEVPGPVETYVEVRFEGGQRGLLDMSVHRGAAWADVLRSLRERNEPAYVEINPETGLVTELRLPRRFTVGRIEPTTDGLTVELIISHTGHYLRHSNDDFAELRATLEAAQEQNTPVLVTETDDHEIIDVRALDEPTEAGN